MGDGVLAAFDTAAGALRWAEAVQRRLREEPVGPAGAPPIVLRVAVHVGEVVEHADGLYGDCVNVAARLQDHADPGGVLLSEAAAGALGPDRPELRDLGHLGLKNIDRPVRAFALGPAPPPTRLTARLAPAGLPSIAVLPFLEEGGAPGAGYFGDGVVADTILSLSGLRELHVVAHGSTLGFRGRRAAPTEVGRALGVRYVLGGRLRRSGGRLRLVAELAEAETGGTVWVERMELPEGELFDMQDRLVERVVAGIAPSVRATELARALR